MASLVFSLCIVSAFRGRINTDADDFAVMLLDEGYTPSKDEHQFRSDVIEHEIQAKGYNKGGLAVDVSIGLVTLDGGVSAVDLHLGAAQWSGTISARYAAYYCKRGSADEDDLIAVIDFGGNIVSTNALWSVDASTMRIEN